MATSSAKPSSGNGDSKTKAAATTEKTSAKTPAIHWVLIATTLVGLGAIVGYIVFYSIYNHRCSDMMDDAERKFNDTQQELQNNLIEAMHSSNQYDQQESELLELRGRLQSQTGLMEKHEGLLDKHQSVVEQLATTRKKQEESRTNAVRLAKEVETSKRQLGHVQNALQKVRRERDEIAQQLQDATGTVTELQEQLQDVASSSCAEQQSASITHIQQLHKSLCEKSQGPGPYYVQFVVNVEGAEEQPNFVVEIPTLEELPNSVFAFVTLLQHNVYREAEFFLTQSVMHLDSDEVQVSQIGYALSALAVVEDVRQGPCAPYSIGFVGSTGGLKIIMTNDASKHGSLSCFGRIAQGRQTMSLIQKATREGKAVSIASVDYVSLDERPSVGEGEL